jgi:carboxymethylenebutenolidase
MARSVDYYFTSQSPLDLPRARALRTHWPRQQAPPVNLLPADLRQGVSRVSGGLPLGQRAPQRQAYRLVDLARFSRQLKLPMNLEAEVLPVAADDAGPADRRGEPAGRRRRRR